MFIGLIDLIQFAPDLVAQFDRNIHLMNGYYTLIRFVVKIGSVAHVLTEIENGQNFREFFFWTNCNFIYSNHTNLSQ